MDSLLFDSKLLLSFFFIFKLSWMEFCCVFVLSLIGFRGASLTELPASLIMLALLRSVYLLRSRFSMLKLRDANFLMYSLRLSWLLCCPCSISCLSALTFWTNKRINWFFSWPSPSCKMLPTMWSTSESSKCCFSLSLWFSMAAVISRSFSSRKIRSLLYSISSLIFSSNRLGPMNLSFYFYLGLKVTISFLYSMLFEFVALCSSLWDS